MYRINHQHQRQQHIFPLKTLNIPFRYSQISLTQESSGIEWADEFEVVWVDFHFALDEDYAVSESTIVLVDVFVSGGFGWG